MVREYEVLRDCHWNNILWHRERRGRANRVMIEDGLKPPEANFRLIPNHEAETIAAEQAAVQAEAAEASLDQAEAALKEAEKPPKKKTSAKKPAAKEDEEGA